MTNLTLLVILLLGLQSAQSARIGCPGKAARRSSSIKHDEPISDNNSKSPASGDGKLSEEPENDAESEVPEVSTEEPENNGDSEASENSPEGSAKGSSEVSAEEPKNDGDSQAEEPDNDGNSKLSEEPENADDNELSPEVSSKAASEEPENNVDSQLSGQPENESEEEPGTDDDRELSPEVSAAGSSEKPDNDDETVLPEIPQLSSEDSPKEPGNNDDSRLSEAVPDKSENDEGNEESAADDEENESVSKPKIEKRHKHLRSNKPKKHHKKARKEKPAKSHEKHKSRKSSSSESRKTKSVDDESPQNESADENTSENRRDIVHKQDGSIPWFRLQPVQHPRSNVPVIRSMRLPDPELLTQVIGHYEIPAIPGLAIDYPADALVKHVHPPITIGEHHHEVAAWPIFHDTGSIINQPTAISDVNPITNMINNILERYNNFKASFRQRIPPIYG